jgi:hypothetical protein
MMVAMPEASDDEAPERLRDGRYVVRGSLGSGTQGETLVAWDESLEREVALKRFRVRGASSWKDVELAEREATVLATLEHRALPRYLEHFEERGCLYLAMERVEGETLSSLIASGTSFGAGEAWRFLADCADVLGYLHARTPPIVHRDIKPANVIRRPDGSFALVDFGSVQHRLRPSGGSTVSGTFGYMAPEQLHGRASPESDVYAVGATALALLCGNEPEHLPHRGLAIDVAKALGRRGDPRLVGVLQAMLEPEPERRAGSIAALLSGRGPQRRRGGLVAVAFVAALGFAGGAWLLAKGSAKSAAGSEAEARDDWVQTDFLAASRALARAGEDAPVTASVVAAHLMGSDPERAAAASRKLAVKHESRRATTLLCLADALDAKSGDRDAHARLESASSAERSPLACRLLLADLESGAQRLRHASALSDTRFHWIDGWDAADRYAEALLAFEADPSKEPPLPRFYPLDQLFSPHALLVQRPLGLELGLVWKNPEGLLLRALFESYLGDHAAAARALSEALHAAGVRAHGGAAKPGNLFEYRIAGSEKQRLPFRHLFFLGAVLATRAGETKNARTYVDLAPEETHGRRALLPFLAALEGGGTPRSGVHEYDPAGKQLQLWKVIGDARDPALAARLLEKQRSLALAVLPFAPPERVRNGELRRWVENDLEPPCWGCTPQAAFRDLVELRRIAQVVGSDALETELEKRVERVRTALTRRDIAIPLYLLARFEP